MNRIKTLNMGVTGRGFHKINTDFRDNEAWAVIAFMATHIPNIDQILLRKSR